MMASRETHDVFVSYRQREPEQTWVLSDLVPRLIGSGLQVIADYMSFRLGAPLISEMERAVELSRYTLAVMTPAYLDSTFTELEHIMATHLGLERAERRLVVVVREATHAPLTIRARLWLDMTDDATFDADVARLSAELRSDRRD